MMDEGIPLDRGPSQHINKNAWWEVITAVYNFLSASTSLAQALDKKYVLNENVHYTITPSKPLLLDGPREGDVNVDENPFFKKLLSETSDLTEITTNKFIEEGLIQMHRLISRSRIQFDRLDVNSKFSKELVPAFPKTESITDHDIVVNALRCMHCSEQFIDENFYTEYDNVLINLANQYNSQSLAVDTEHCVKEYPSIDAVESSSSVPESVVSESSTSLNTINSAAMDTVDTLDGNSKSSTNLSSNALGSTPLLAVCNSLAKITNSEIDKNNETDSSFNKVKNEATSSHHPTKRFDSTLKSQVSKTPKIQQELIQYSRENHTADIIHQLKKQLDCVSKYETTGIDKKEVYNYIMKISEIVTALETEQLEQSLETSSKNAIAEKNKEKPPGIKIEETKTDGTVLECKNAATKCTQSRMAPANLKETQILNSNKDPSYIETVIKPMHVEKPIKQIKVSNLKDGRGPFSYDKSPRQEKIISTPKPDINLRYMIENAERHVERAIEKMRPKTVKKSAIKNKNTVPKAPDSRKRNSGFKRQKSATRKELINMISNLSSSANNQTKSLKSSNRQSSKKPLLQKPIVSRDIIYQLK